MQEPSATGAAFQETSFAELAQAQGKGYSREGPSGARPHGGTTQMSGLAPPPWAPLPRLASHRGEVHSYSLSLLSLPTQQ